ncbi:MAG TPA: hypothetical protein ENI95_14440 [Chloroflexi bacterium]|nr:hypothetical protein [Chloroflexota bacterium]
MSILDKVWHVYVGDSWIGTLAPTGADDSWYYADFTEGDAWGNFAPWFREALAAFQAEDAEALEKVYSQLWLMGLVISAEDGESYTNPTVYIDGANAWFSV